MKRTVVIASQDPSTVYLLQRYAEEGGYSAVHVDAGGDVAYIALHAQPAIILLEIERPTAAGWAVLEELKRDRSTADIPVIVCSWLEEDTCGAPEDLVEQAAGYLQKPVLYHDFVVALAEAAA